MTRKLLLLKSKNLKYDCWLHWNMTSICNFNCKYCFYYNQHTPIEAGFLKHDIKRIFQTLEDTGKIFRIGLTGNGEPFLQPDIYELIEPLSPKHYFSFNTNLVALDVEKFAFSIKPQKVTELHASCHPAELINRNLHNVFITKFLQLQNSDYPIICRMVAFSGEYSEIDIMGKMLEEAGIDYAFEPFIGTFQNKRYPEAYSERELQKYNLKSSKFSFTGKKCNAGFNAFVVTPIGKVFACFQENKSLGSIYQGFSFTDGITNCRHKVCGCPLHLYDQNLYQNFLYEIKTNSIFK